MAVHPNSLIPTWVANWRPDFYTSITNKEEWSYVNGGPAQWGPIYDKLVQQMTQYRIFNREDEIIDFLTTVYGYEVLHMIYNTSHALVPQLDERAIYNMAGFVDSTLSRPVNYYNDIALNPETGLNDSAKMNADVAVVAAATGVETPRIESRASAATKISRRFTYDLLFKDVPTTGTMTKQGVGEFFFNQLHWKEAFVLNVGTLTLPPYIG